MRDYPKGGMIGKTVHFVRSLRNLQVSLHAAYACYFMVLAVFPALLLLLSLLRYTSLEVERLGEMLYGFFPEALAVGAEELVLLTWDHTSGTMLGVSAVTALWSAGRGIYGMLAGLNVVYGREETRSYLHTRLLSGVYLFAFLLMMLLSLGLHVFTQERLMLRFPVLLLMQTLFFTALFAVLPAGKNGFRESLPGAVLAALGWQIFSDLYSVYVEHFAVLSNVYGSVYAVSLSMLWLYCCISILFYGGALNARLKGSSGGTGTEL